MSQKVKLSIDTMIVSETDAKGNIIFTSYYFCKIARYTMEELIGKPHNIVRHKDI